MIIYSYNPQTLEYVGFRNARLDPEETKIQGQDVFLIPANSTTHIPPEFTENQTCKFIGVEWVVEDKPEPKPAPEPTPEEQIASLKKQLTDTDYKIIKLYEYFLAGITDVPYNIEELHTERQAIRDQINLLENAGV